MQILDLIARSQKGDKDAAGQLLEENAGLIWSVAKRYFGRGVEPDDLFQLGSVGFLKAVENFNLAYGTQFSTYAVPKIAGEIRRFLRDDGTVKVSRTMKERAAAVRRAAADLAAALGREPVLSEIAAACGLTSEEVAEAETVTTEAASFQQPSGDGGQTLEDLIPAGDMEDRIVERISLQQALSQLPERERRVVQLRYFHGLTQDRTARILDVSQVQISRIEKKALAKLRNLL